MSDTTDLKSVVAAKIREVGVREIIKNTLQDPLPEWTKSELHWLKDLLENHTEEEMSLALLKNWSQQALYQLAFVHILENPLLRRQTFPTVREHAPALFMEVFQDPDDSWATREQKFIDTLNALEYALAEWKALSLMGQLTRANGVSVRDLQVGENLVAELRMALAWIQGGDLDRLALRHKSVIELQHLSEETEASIKEIDERKEERRGTWGKVGRHVEQRFNLPEGLSELLQELLPIPDPNKYDLWVKKQLLSEIKLSLKRAAQQPTSLSEKPVRELIAKFEVLSELRKKKEELLAQHTDPEDQKLLTRLFYEKEMELLEQS